MIALVAPGGILYELCNGFVSQVLVLILGQIIPLFLIPFLPFAFKDAISLKFGFLNRKDVLPSSQERPLIGPQTI